MNATDMNATDMAAESAAEAIEANAEKVAEDVPNASIASEAGSRDNAATESGYDANNDAGD